MKWPVQLNLTIKPLEERHAVTAGVFGLTAALLLMARENPALWDVELFKTLLTAVVVTGILNMVLSFHFAANKRDEEKSENTGAAFRAIEATARASATPMPVEVVNDTDQPVPVQTDPLRFTPEPDTEG